MTMYVIFVSIGILAALVSAAGCWLMIRAGIADVPDHRSNHKDVTPTAGGVGVLLGVVTAWIGFYLGGQHHGYTMSLWPVLGSILIFGGLGLLDDKLAPPTLIKFALMVVLMIWIAVEIGPVTKIPGLASIGHMPFWAGLAGTVLWLFVVTNGVNFMDGSNGILGVSFIVANAGLIGVMAEFELLQQMWLPIGMIGGLAGFLFFNLREKARIFAGDVGSLSIGFAFAISIIELENLTPQVSILFVGPLLILPFLVDVLLTLLRRAKNGENLLNAHRGHLYQRLIAAGATHMQIAWSYGAAAFIMLIYTIIILRSGLIDNPAVLAGPVVIFSIVYFVISRRLDRIS